MTGGGGSSNHHPNPRVDVAELELVTPPLDGLILPGVIRQSLLEMAREWVWM